MFNLPALNDRKRISNKSKVRVLSSRKLSPFSSAISTELSQKFEQKSNLTETNAADEKWLTKKCSILVDRCKAGVRLSRSVLRLVVVHLL